ncbi:adenylyl-sulfate kinase [Kineococcus sp. SYSU DK001]|uniref:adenylyl-sulfate kinase n=1 Tax=Kineococcus sp. SYSU DK001 TaxID=3383122 RepID=UPI003D7EFB32
MTPAALLLTGTVGSGKTTTANALGVVLRAAGVPHAVVDLDALRDAWPSPPDDPFHERLELANLRDVARNHRAAGAVRLVLAGVLEDPAHRGLYEDAVGVPLTVCRLRPDLTVVADRLQVRHAGDGTALDWHLHRSSELDAILHSAGIGDVVVDVRAHDEPAAVAAAVARAVGWS